MKTEEGLPSVEEFVEDADTERVEYENGDVEFLYKKHTVIAILEELAEQVRNETLRIAAEEVRVFPDYEVDKKSILDLKDDPRLQIR